MTSRVLCECSSGDCLLSVELARIDEQDALRRGDVIVIVDGCPHGPDAGDVLVERRDGYGLFRAKEKT